MKCWIPALEISYTRLWSVCSRLVNRESMVFIYGQDMDVISLTNAFLTRDLDFETSFTYAYSKIVGLQAGGPYQLKQDYVSLSAGTTNI